jgi:hypothetical protein
MKKFLILFAVSTLFLSPKISQAQQQAPGEILLKEIKVKPQVDKPRVNIATKRMEPDFEEFYIERNFDTEIRQLNTQIIGIIPENEPVAGRPDIARLTSRKRR